MHKYVSLNGDIKEFIKTTLHISDISIQRGFGVFDFFRIENGKFKFQKHYLNRFYNSVGLAGIKLPFDRREVADMVLALIKKNKAENSYIKLVATGGYSPDGFTIGMTPNLLIYNYRMRQPVPGLYKTGANLISDEYMRPTPEIKTTNYFNAVRLSPTMKKFNAVDVLYHYDNQVYETSRANVFMIKKDIVYTAKRDILEGITRKRLRKAISAEFDICYKPFSLKKLLKSDEVFITSTTKDVLPIKKIDKHIIGKGKIGKVSKKIIALFNRPNFQI